MGSKYQEGGFKQTKKQNAKTASQSRVPEQKTVREEGCQEAIREGDVKGQCKHHGACKDFMGEICNGNFL